MHVGNLGYFEINWHSTMYRDYLVYNIRYYINIYILIPKFIVCFNFRFHSHLICYSVILLFILIISIDFDGLCGFRKGFWNII